MAYGFIYIVTNLVNNKKYIGQRKFSKNDNSYLGSGTAIKLAVKKYGKDNFIRETLCICNSAEELNEAENFYTSQVNAENNPEYYNLRSGGGQQGFSEITRKKLSEASKNNKRWLGKKHTEETRKKISESAKGNIRWLGKTHTAESRKKMSERQSNRSQVHKDRISSGRKGIFPSEATRKKLSEARKGKKQTPEHIKARIEPRKKYATDYSDTPIQKYKFKALCVRDGVNFNDFEEVFSGSKLKSGTKLFYYRAIDNKI